MRPTCSVFSSFHNHISRWVSSHHQWKSPETLKTHQVNLSTGTRFSCNVTPASLCSHNHMTMAPVCRTSGGEVTGDVRDVHGLISASQTGLSPVLRFSPHMCSPAVGSTCTGRRMIFNLLSVYVELIGDDFHVYKQAAHSVLWILTGTAHKYLWCCDISRASKENCVLTGLRLLTAKGGKKNNKAHFSCCYLIAIATIFLPVWSMIYGFLQSIFSPPLRESFRRQTRAGTVATAAMTMKEMYAEHNFTFIGHYYSWIVWSCQVSHFVKRCTNVITQQAPMNLSVHKCQHHGGF